MTPRGFLDALKTQTGRLLVFTGLVVGAGVLVLTFRERSEDDGGPVDARLSPSIPTTNQVVERITRPLELFRPPPPKAEPQPPPARQANPVVQPSAPPLKEPMEGSPVTLFQDSPVPTPKRIGAVHAPFGRLIPCQTVITVDSAAIQTPIIGLVTENIYHAGQLIVPAGTEVHGTAQTDRSRERIAGGGNWRLVWQTGEELSLNALVLDREFFNSTNQTGWAITDGSAGIRGQLLKSDDLAEIKLFAATFLSGAAAALTEKELTLLGSIDSRSLNNAPLKGAQDVLKVYAQRIQESIQRDGFYVRVPSGKQFYLYVLQSIDPAEARLGGLSAENPSTSSDLR